MKLRNFEQDLDIFSKQFFCEQKLIIQLNLSFQHIIVTQSIFVFPITELGNRLPPTPTDVFFKSWSARFQLLTCSWHQKTKPLIHQFTNSKCYIKARKSCKTTFYDVLFLIYSFKKHFKICFFHFKGFIRHFEVL